MRTQTLAFLLSSLAAVACSPYGEASEVTAPSPNPRDSTTAPSSPSPSSSPTSHGVQGKLVDSLGAPAPKARIRVVDAKGNVQDATANVSGAFSFADVATPYDVRVLPPQGVVGFPQAYFGLTEKELRVSVPTAGAAPTIWNKGTITVPVNVGACPSCTVQVYTTSPGPGIGGFGQTSFTATNGPSTTSVSVEHTWATTGNPAPSGTVTVDVLVSDAAFTTFQYKRSGGGVLQPDGTMSIYGVSPTAIGKFGPVTITVNDAEVPNAWSRGLQVFLELPGTQVSMVLQRVASHALVTNVPNIPGATFAVAASARGETKYDAEYNVVVDRSTRTDTADLPLSTATTALTLHAGPTMVRPLPEGELSLESAGLAWTAKPGRVIDLRLLNASTSTPAGRLVTSEAAISFARLAKLGVTLEPGTHTLEVNTYGGSVGGLVATAPPPRPRDWTRDDYRFTLTP